MSYGIIQVPCGRLKICAENGCIISCGWTEEAPRESEDPLIRETADQIRDYFLGIRTEFTVPCRPQGTDFEKKIWTCIAEIPYGGVATYGEIAEKAGHPGAARAAGRACGRNPCVIIVPCHRVVARHGDGGYTGGMKYKYALWKTEHIDRRRKGRKG